MLRHLSLGISRMSLGGRKVGWLAEAGWLAGSSAGTGRYAGWRLVGVLSRLPWGILPAATLRVSVPRLPLFTAF